MNINAVRVNTGFLYYSGLVKKMNIYDVKNAENRSRLNSSLPSPLAVVKTAQQQAALLQVVLLEREQVVKPSKTGCFTSILRSNLRSNCMLDSLFPILLFIGYILLMRFVLPKFGVST